MVFGTMKPEILDVTHLGRLFLRENARGVVGTDFIRPRS